MQQVEPRPIRWTRERYYQMLDMGFFLERRVELIEGEIIEMSAQKNLHAMGVDLTADALRAAFGPNHWVRVQMTLDLSSTSAPDPDVAVVPGSTRSYAGRSNPTTAMLIVEVSETSLAYDRGRKASLYASVGIGDYWILNLVQRQLEIYRDPAVDAAQMFGFKYAVRTILDPGDTVAPLAAPKALVAVADLLP